VLSETKIESRKVVATMVSVSALAVTMHSLAFADGKEDDFEIAPIFLAKPSLPLFNPAESPTTPLQLPFPSDFREVSCPCGSTDSMLIDQTGPITDPV
jgi:hypothetical protein